MRLASNGEYTMSKQEVIEFSSWLDQNPKERYKRFNQVVQAYIASTMDESLSIVSGV